MPDDEAPPPLPERAGRKNRAKDPPRKPERIYGTDALIDALNRLCQSGEYEKLMRYAYYRMRGIRGRVVATDARDLLHEAIIRTRDQMTDDEDRAPKGIRAWNPKKKPLYEHLVSTMRSIGNELAKKGGRFTASSEWLISPEDVHSQFEDKANIQRLRTALRSDTLASAVLESILNGEKPQEAHVRLKIPPWDYEKAYKRVIRRGKLLLRPKRKAS